MLTWRKIAALAVRRSVGFNCYSITSRYIYHVIFLLWTFWHGVNVSHRVGSSERPTSIMLLGAIAQSSPCHLYWSVDVSGLSGASQCDLTGGSSIIIIRPEGRLMVNLLRPLTSLPLCVFSSGQFFQIGGSFQLLHRKEAGKNPPRQRLSVCVCRSDQTAVCGILTFFKQFFFFPASQPCNVLTEQS